jgi:hypothetical protein
MKRRLPLLVSVMGLVILAICIAVPSLWKVGAVSWIVRDATGQPLPGATVRFKTSQTTTQTDIAGRFVLSGFPKSFQVRVTAWKDGYYLAGADAWSWETVVDITLSPYAVPDNADYHWVSLLSRLAPR